MDRPTRPMRIYARVAPFLLIPVAGVMLVDAALFDRCFKQCLSTSTLAAYRVSTVLAGLLFLGAGVAITRLRDLSTEPRARTTVILGFACVLVLGLWFFVRTMLSVEKTT
jgi:hypothetical protein